MKLRIALLQKFEPPEEGLYGLVTEAGELLYTHYCSNRGFAYGDLFGNRPERQEELRNRFGIVEFESA